MHFLRLNYTDSFAGSDRRLSGMHVLTSNYTDSSDQIGNRLGCIFALEMIPIRQIRSTNGCDVVTTLLTLVVKITDYPGPGKSPILKTLTRSENQA